MMFFFSNAQLSEELEIVMCVAIPKCENTIKIYSRKQYTCQKDTHQSEHKIAMKVKQFYSINNNIEELLEIIQNIGTCKLYLPHNYSIGRCFIH